MSDCTLKGVRTSAVPKAQGPSRGDSGQGSGGGGDWICLVHATFHLSPRSSLLHQLVWFACPVNGSWLTVGGKARPFSTVFDSWVDGCEGWARSWNGSLRCAATSELLY